MESKRGGQPSSSSSFNNRCMCSTKRVEEGDYLHHRLALKIRRGYISLKWGQLGERRFKGATSRRKKGSTFFIKNLLK